MLHNKIMDMLEIYRQSIEQAGDISQVEKVWMTDENASLIFPLGMELGWNAIRDNFYGATMSGRFQDRKLIVSGKPTIQD